MLCLSSLLVGLLIGAASVGGVLLIPALMYFGGLGTHQAMGTALFSFLFTGLLATWAFQRHGSFDWSVTLPVCAGSLMSGFAGAAAGAHVSPQALNLFLAGLIICSSLYPLLPLPQFALATRLDRRGNRFLLLTVGLFTGFVCGMTGAGGGIVSLPLMLILGYPIMASIATGQVLQSIVALSGSLSNLHNGFIDFTQVWPVTAFELAGVILGVWLAHLISPALVRRVGLLVCLAIGALLILRTLT